MSKKIKGKVKIGLLILFTLLSVSLLLINHRDVQSSGTNYTIDVPTTWTQTVDCGTLTVNSTLTLDSSAGTPITINADSITVNSGGKISADAKGYSGGTGLSNISFVDSETTPKTVTPNGNAQLSNVQSKFGGGAGYFDGTGDYLSLADSADWDFGSGDFTVDFWLRFNTVAPAEFVGQIDSIGNNTSWLLFYDQGDGNRLRFMYSSNGATLISLNCSWTPSANTWYHIAAVRSGTTLKVYVNGTQVGSTGDVTGVTIYNSTLPLRVGFGESYYLNGYLDEIRISKGVARWTENFTPPTAPYTSDSYTKLLLHANGCTDGSGTGAGIGGAAFSNTQFKDSEDTAKTLTANGGAQLSPLQGKFGGSSAYLDGTGDYLSLADNDDWDFGTGDFTIDFWVRFNTLPDTSVAQTLFTNEGYSSGSQVNLYNASGTLKLYFYIVGENTNANWTPSIGTWYHLVFVRASGTAKMFVNGTQLGTDTTLSGNITGLTSGLIIGSYAGSSQYTDAYIDEFRISKGIARWTANFTPPTAPYTSDSYTKLLMHADGSGAGGAAYVAAGGNGVSALGGTTTYGSATEPITLGSGGGGAGFSSTTFIDSETTPKIVTANGDAKITNAQNKFGAVSAYFPGTASYLSVADSDDWNFGTGDFTIDFWINLANWDADAYQPIFANYENGNNYWSLHTYYAQNRFRFVSTVGGTPKALTTDVHSLTDNTWHHIALVRSSGNFTWFIDGNIIVTVTDDIGTNSIANPSAPLTIGYSLENVEHYLNGYIDELRISKGIARWTENFTPPTAPYTSDSYTKLLLHMGGGQGAGGAGAGAMKLVVAGTLTNDGTISANGADGVVGGGAGSGGSIWAICDTLAGSGSFSANGGSGGGAGGAGGGGRIRLSSSAANTFSGTTTMSAGTGCVTSSGAAASGTLSSAKITTASVVAGATSNTTINFTTVNAVPTNGTIEVDFPSGYDLSGTLAYVSNTGVTGSNITLSVTNGNTLVIALGSGTSISANTAVSIVVSGIKNPNLLGSTGTFTIRTKTAAGVIIDQVVGTSLAVDKITVPTLTITSPNGAEDWAVGSSHNITWTYNGTISGNLGLYYATDGGTSYNTIASGLSNSGTYSWTVPAVPAPGTTNKVKIQDTFYQTFTDTQNTDFTGGTLFNTVISGTGGSAGVVLGVDTSSPILGTYTVGTNPYGAAFDSVTNSIWVTNGGDITVTKLRASDAAILGTYTVGLIPLGIVFDSSTNSVWVTNYGSTTVTKLRVSDSSILGTYTVGTSPVGVCFDSSTNSVWVANNSSHDVSKLRCSDGANLGTYTATTTYPRGVVFDSSTNSVWVANGATDNVTKLRASDAAILGTYTVGSGPYRITFDSSTNSIWVANYGSTTVTKLQASDGANLGTYTTGTSPLGIAFDPLTNSIWVANNYNGSGGNTVSKLSAATGTKLADYSTGTNPWDFTFDSSSNSIWVVNYGSNTITKLRALDIVKAGDYSTGTSPDSVAFDSSTNSVWVTNAGSANVSKLNATNGANLGTYNVGSSPWGIAFDSSTNSVWAVNRESANVSKLSAANGTNLGNYGVGSYPASVAFDSSTNSIWVANYISSNLSKLRASDGANLGTYAAGTNPQFVTFDSSTNSIWVGNTTSDNVSKLRVSDGANLGTYTVGSAPAGVAFDSSTNSVWVVNSNSNTVSKLRASDGASLGTYSTGGSPWSVVFDSITNSVWVTNYGSSGAGTTVSKLQASNGTILAYYVVGTGPRGIAFDPLTNSIWVANKTSNTVSKLPIAPYYINGNFTSRAIDVGASNTLSTLNYTATLPTNTTLKFQVAANNDNSTWSFVGTDGTANTYFTTSGTAIPTGIASSQYLKYKAFLTTSEPLITPTLSDVSIGFSSTNSSYGTISDASNANFTITSAGATSASVTPANLVVGVSGNVAVNFTNINAIPIDGKVVITFPADFTLPSTGNYTATKNSGGLDGTLTPTTSSQVITITRSGGSSAAAGVQSITLSNIQNPIDTCTTGSYTIQTQNSSSYLLDTATVSGSSITNGGTLTSTSVVPASLFTSAVGNVTAAFTTINPIPANGKILITFPSGYVLSSGGTTTASSTTLNGSLGVSIADQVVTLTRSGGTQASVGAHNITLTYIKNPTAGGATNTYTIQTNTSSNDTSTGKIDYNNAVAASFINGYLSSASIAHVSYIAGATSNTTIAFTTVNAISANGTIEVDFPSSYDLSGTLAYVSNTGVTGTSITPSVTNGNTLVITLGSNTSISANTAVSIVISGIKNPSLLGSTGTYTIRTKSSAGALIDQVTGVTAQTITVPTLTISSPNGTEDWTVGSSHNITWTYNGAISNNLGLYYATDGGTAYNSIANGLSNSGTYSWTVPAVPAPGTTNKVKIQDTFYQTLKDSSSAEFTGGVLVQTAVSGTGWSGSVVLSASTVPYTTYTDFAGPRFLAFDPISNSIWVTNGSSNFVNKLRPSDGERIGTYYVGSNPCGIIFNSVDNSIWVANNGASNPGTISRFNASDGSRLGTYTSGNTPYRFANFDSSTNSIWVTSGSGVIKHRASDGFILSTTTGVGTATICFDSYTNSIWTAVGYSNNSYYKIQASDGSLVNTFNPDSQRHGDLVFDPSTNSVWMGKCYNAVAKIDPTSGAITGHYGSDYGLGIGFDPLTNSIWQAGSSERANYLEIIKASSGAIQTQRYSLLTGGYYNTVGFCSDPSTGSMWVAVYANNKVIKLRAVDTQLVGTYTNSGALTYSYCTAFEPVSNSIWVANYHRSSVTKVRVTDGSTTEVTVGANPYALVLNPYTNSLWVTNIGSNPGTISKIRPTDNTLIGTYTIGTGLAPCGIIYESQTNSIWVATNTSPGVIIKIRASDSSILGTYTAGANPRNLAFDSSTGSIWITNKGANPGTVSKLSAADGHNIGTYTTGTGYYPLSIAFDSSTNSIWVANHNGFSSAQKVYKFNAYDGSLISSFAGPGHDGAPGAVAFDSSTNSIWVTGVAEYYSGVLERFNGAGGNTAVEAIFFTDNRPFSIAFDPITNSIWTANYSETVGTWWEYSTIQKFSPRAPYNSVGNFTSRSIDVGASNTLSALSYTAATPANTTLQLQVAGSTDGTNFSSFIGSDNTSATYLTSGASIPSSLTSDRYLKYKAYFTTSDSAVTPTLSDASISFTSGTSSETTISDASNANFTITSAAIGSGTASVTPASLVVGVTGNVTASFTNVNAIPADGKVVITFPVGFILPATGNYTATKNSGGLDGILTPTTSSQTITITRSGGSSTAAGAQSITLSNIQNPSAAGTTGTYSLQTQSSAGYIIDNASNITGSTIVAVPLTLTSPDPAATQTFKAGTHARIKVEDADNTQVFDVSDVDLTIAYPSITITSPNGWENWTVGSTHNITWTTDSAAITAVKLEYSTDAGTTWNVITASAPNTGTYAWTLNGLFVTDQLKVRATGLAGFSSLTLSGTAASKMSGVAYLESSKTLFMDVLSDFSAGDTLVISGHKFCNFSVSDASHLWLDLYDNGASDARIIQVSASSPVFSGGSSDGWAYAERALATF